MLKIPEGNPAWREPLITWNQAKAQERSREAAQRAKSWKIGVGVVDVLIDGGHRIRSLYVSLSLVHSRWWPFQFRRRPLPERI